MKIIVVLSMLLLSACVSTPSLITGPGTNAAGEKVAPPPAILTGIAADIQDASYNLDQAIAVGALSANDPAAKCAHDALVQAGVELPAGAVAAKSFVPKKGSILADGAILYIIAQQSKNGPSFTVDMSCKALLGQMVIDGLGAARKSLPGIIGRLVGL